MSAGVDLSSCFQTGPGPETFSVEAKNHCAESFRISGSITGAASKWSDLFLNQLKIQICFS